MANEKSPLLSDSQTYGQTPRNGDPNDDVIERIYKSLESKDEEVPICCSYRLMVILCCTVSMTFSFAAQASMSSAMVCMIADEKTNSQNVTLPNTTLDYFYLNATTNETDENDWDDWKFSWSKETQGFVLSTFFMGYYVSQLPAGLAAARFGAKKVIVLGLILGSIFQGLAVPAAYYGVGILYADRILAGIVGGFLYAPTFALVGQWAPRHETSLLFGIVGMGMELGNVLAFAISLPACEIHVQGGWPFVFYILAAIGLITALLFIIFVSDSPYNNRFISRKEVRFIASFIPKMENNPKAALTQIPVKEIMKSMPVWAIIVSQIASDWLYYFFVTMGPQFLKDVIKLSNFETNLLSGLPFLGVIPTIYIAGYICDKLVINDIVSNTSVRKINDFVCKIIPGAILIGLGFLPAGSVAAAFVLNFLGATFIGFSYVSWMANPVDLAPAYTGFIVGVCEIGAIWVAIAVPIIFEVLTRDGTREEWQLMFYITGGLQAFGFLFYALFASGDLQPWALTTDKQCYDDIDAGGEHWDLKNKSEQVGDRSKSTSVDSVLDSKKSDAEKETQKLIKSLSLSLGGFRGTASYEDDVRKRCHEGGQIGEEKEGTRTLHTSGPAQTRSPLESGQDIIYDASALNRSRTSLKVFTDQFVNVPSQIDNAVLVTSSVMAAGEVGVIEIESDILARDEDSRIQATSAGHRHQVRHNRGDYGVEPNVSSITPVTPGQFDDAESSFTEERNVKSLATEIAEALSHSLDSSSGSSITLKDRGQLSKNVAKTQDGRRKNKAKSGSTAAKKLRNEKIVVSGDDSSTSSAREAALDGRGKLSRTDLASLNMNYGNSSSIMVPSDELDSLLEKDTSESPNFSSHSKSTKEGKKARKEPGQISSLVKKFFTRGKNRSNPLPTEETVLVLTDEEDTNPFTGSGSWAAKSYETVQEFASTSSGSWTTKSYETVREFPSSSGDSWTTKSYDTVREVQEGQRKRSSQSDSGRDVLITLRGGKTNRRRTDRSHISEQVL